MKHLWQHQQDALRFFRRVGSGLAWMAMGTGKSRVVVELIEESSDDPILILAPKSVLGVWLREFKRWTRQPDMWNVVILDKGSTAAKAKKVQQALLLDSSTRRAAPHSRPPLDRRRRVVIVVNYESAWRGELGKYLAGREWGWVICDESHKIKSHSSKVSKFAMRLHAERRLCLTGTPLSNSPLDAYAQFRFLDPRVLGSSFHRFRVRYAKLKTIPGVVVPIVAGYQNLEELHARIAPYTFKVGVEVLDLLPVQHETIEVTLSPKAAKAYRQMESEFICDVTDGVVTASNALVRLLRLAQIANGHVPADDADELTEIDSSKRDALCDIVESLPPDESIVVFGRFLSDLRAAQWVSEQLGREYREISGARKDINDHGEMLDGPQVLAVQIASGGVGIDLTGARYCVYMSTGFSLGEYEQSLARLDRPGQQHHVTYYHLVATGTVDEKVREALETKKDVITTILEGAKHGADTGTPATAHPAG